MSNLLVSGRPFGGFGGARGELTGTYSEGTITFKDGKKWTKLGN